MIINELSSDVSYTSDYFWLLNINKVPNKNPLRYI